MKNRATLIKSCDSIILHGERIVGTANPFCWACKINDAERIVDDKCDSIGLG